MVLTQETLQTLNTMMERLGQLQTLLQLQDLSWNCRNSINIKYCYWRKNRNFSKEVATNDVQEYDGTSWTAGGDYITVVKENTAWGTTNDCIQAGGSIPSATATCAIYDGTAWATTASLPSALTLNATSQGTTNTNSGFVVGGFHQLQQIQQNLIQKQQH